MSCQIIKGPCLVTFTKGGTTHKIWTTDGVEVTLSSKTFGINTDAHGTVDSRLEDNVYTVNFTPIGDVNGAIVTLTKALVNAAVGSQLFGGYVMEIKPMLSGQTGLKFFNAALTKAPSFTAASTKQPWGAMTFTALTHDSGFVEDLAYAEVTDVPYPTSIVTQPWTGTWDVVSGTPTEDNVFTDIETENGWTAEFNTSLDADVTDSCGTVGMTLVDSTATVKCIPLGLTETQILALLSSNDAAPLTRGASMILPAKHLRLECATNFALFKNAGIAGSKLAWGAKKNRQGELEFIITRPVTGGQLFDLAD